MDQFDLFTTQDHTPSTHDATPASYIEPADHPVAIEAEAHEGTVWAFAQREATRLWDRPTHRERSLAQLQWFVRFADHTNRPITDYLPKHIHAFADSLAEQGLKPTPSIATSPRYRGCLHTLLMKKKLPTHRS